MDLELRPWTPDETPAVLGAVERSFLGDPAHAPDRITALDEHRTLSAWDGGRPVATAAAFSLQLAVPGAVVPTAGVTLVSVQATHRRRGLLHRMMQRQLEDLHVGGEALAALWASEAAIYGRFGYGLASRSLVVDLRGAPALRAPAPLGGVEEVDPEQAQPRLAAVWERSFRHRPGEYARDDRWWPHVLHDPPHERHGRSPLRCVVLDDDTGYALFSTKGGWDDRGAAGEVLVLEVAGTDGAAQLRLWQHLLGLDLVSRWRAKRLPLDAPLVHAVADVRVLAPRVADGLFTRLVRVGDALAGRRFGAEVDLVLDVRDPVLPDNARRWRLSGSPDGATCEPTSDPADLALGVEELGAAHLGGTTLLALAAAGRVEERRPGALAAASRALRGDVEPVCSHVF